MSFKFRYYHNTTNRPIKLGEDEQTCHSLLSVGLFHLLSGPRFTTSSFHLVSPSFSTFTSLVMSTPLTCAHNALIPFSPLFKLLLHWTQSQAVDVFCVMLVGPVPLILWSLWMLPVACFPPCCFLFFQLVFLLDSFSFSLDSTGIFCYLFSLWVSQPNPLVMDCK